MGWRRDIEYPEMVDRLDAIRVRQVESNPLNKIIRAPARPVFFSQNMAEWWVAIE
jgi:hypothetical protein